MILRRLTSLRTSIRCFSNSQGNKGPTIQATNNLTKTHSDIQSSQKTVGTNQSHHDSRFVSIQSQAMLYDSKGQSSDASTVTQETVGPKQYVIASKIGGSSADGLYQVYAGSYHNKDLDLFKRKSQLYHQGLAGTTTNETEIIHGATIVTNRQQAEEVLHRLMTISTPIAWDTQTMDLDPKNESPVGRGKIVCASFFAGPQHDFGNGPRVFVDNFGLNAGLINVFKPYLEDPRFPKVFHNFGFDRHVFYNHGINVRGFAGDTMHMARLLDPAKMPGSYSLAALTKEYAFEIQKVACRYMDKEAKKTVDELSRTDSSKPEAQSLTKKLICLQKYEQYRKRDQGLRKFKMEELFRRKKILKTGGEGASYEFPSVLTLHTNIEYLKKWITYALLDSETTFFLREVLQGRWLVQAYIKLSLFNKVTQLFLFFLFRQIYNVGLLFAQKSKQFAGIDNMWALYQLYWREFGQILTDMERVGFMIDLPHVDSIRQRAEEDLKLKRQQFVNFVTSFQKGKNVDLFNPSSSLQLQQLLHAPYEKPDSFTSGQKVDLTPQQNELFEASDLAEQLIYQDTKGVRKPTTLHEKIKLFKVDNDDPTRGRKKIDMEIQGLGIAPAKFTPLGLPSVDQHALAILAGDPANNKYGTAYEHFAATNPEFGRKLCEALTLLLDYRGIETILKTFILPLPSYGDSQSRIHCSLNINTETGRLSARKPNLQNQPALEKDIYKIRKAFRAAPGCKLVIADYGQLELRVLAHLTNCRAMIDSFKQGGDFHSRTAISMYDYIRKDIETGKVLLEWDKSKGAAPAPLLKEKYANQRKKAKTVNFSIAYGKTAKGFAEDWNCTEEEARKVIRAWFSDRPEVEEWQKMKKQIAEKNKLTQTLLGRYRRLDRFFEFGAKQHSSLKGMGQRRAINTPIQGGAADIVIAAMVKISRNEELRQMGWRLLLQIHDELILEGPQQTASQALEIVRNNMEKPFDRDLLVALEVDAKIADNWYEGK